MKLSVILTLLLLTLALAGCSTLSVMPSDVMHNYDAGRKLTAAKKEVENGKSAAAIAILEKLVAEPGVKGVTDEALFRLGLLKLPFEEKDGSLPALLYFDRLRTEYKESSWAQQAKPVHDFLKSVSDMKKHDRSLKAQNSSLSRDNKELRQSIERLKSLDMQLERKSR